MHWSVDDSFDSLAGRNGKEKGGRVMKHKVEKDKLVELVKEWTRIMNTQIKEEGETNYKGK